LEALDVKTRLAAHPPWRQLLIISVALPIIVATAVLAFAWPAAHIAPRDVPIGVVGTGAVSQRAIAGVEATRPGAFDPQLYADEAAARRAIEDRDVYGALVISPQGVSVLTASAASPSVAEILSSLGQGIAHKVGATNGATGAAVPVITTDLVAASSFDPRGLVISSALLPLSICSIIVAAVIALLLNFRPAWRQLLALVSVSTTAGLGAYLIAQTWLGALPHQPLETWAALSLTILAMSSTAAGLIALIGSPGLGLGAALMVFVGNPFSGSTSAPELLPKAVGHIGQWLPPGAGANLVRSTAYFDGCGAAVHLAVLVAWSLFGLLAVFVGHHTFVGYAARRHRAPDARWQPQPARLRRIAEHLERPSCGDQCSQRLTNSGGDPARL
jgi:hypothetical protein